MKLLTTVAILSGAVGALRAPSSLLETPADATRIPSRYESAVMGRRILALSKLATLSTVFPESSGHGRTGRSGHVSTRENRPADLGGIPMGLPEYVADCEDKGNPTILALSIGTSFKNEKASGNITLSVQWTPPYPPSKRISFFSRLSAYVPFLSGQRPYNTSPEPGHASLPDTVPFSAANLPRFSLIGYLERIDAHDSEAVRLASCYTAKHRDARYWLPGNRIHKSEWNRLVVTHVYWIGGFGDRAYIGWIPVEEWNKVTREEWESIQLPGEKKDWDEWNIGESEEL